jgi:hypothetical protein
MTNTETLLNVDELYALAQDYIASDYENKDIIQVVQLQRSYMQIRFWFKVEVAREQQRAALAVKVGN